MNVPVEWILGETEAREAVKQLTSEGIDRVSTEPYRPNADEIDDYGDSAFEPLTLLTFVIAAGIAGTLGTALFNRVKHPGGLIVDTRSGKLRIRPDPRLAQGLCVVVSDTGVEQIKGEALEAKLLTLGISAVLPTKA
jgi:hypothetical protein